jgi:hypothetical protein
LIGRFDSVRQIYSYHRAGLEPGGEKYVPPLAAPGIKNDTVLEIRRRERGDPVEEFSPVCIGKLRVMGPLVTEGVGGGLPIFGEAIGKEAWDTSSTISLPSALSMRASNALWHAGQTNRERRIRFKQTPLCRRRNWSNSLPPVIQ